jgi:DNA-binding NarL/FixJ family response regulator
MIATRVGRLPGMVIASEDAVFSMLCEHLFGNSETVRHLASVTLEGVLEAARRHEPDVILLDIDGLEHEATRQLAAKLALVTDARLVIAGGSLAPGSPDVNRLLQQIEATALLKPSGSASLSLAGADGDVFLDTLARVFDDLPERAR